MISMQRMLSGVASRLSDQERLALLKLLTDLAESDNNYSLIEQIGIESIAAVLFPEQGADAAALAGLDTVDPEKIIQDPEIRQLVLELLCFAALLDDVAHPEEVRMIVRFAGLWEIPFAVIQLFPCFDPIRLLEIGLSETADTFLKKLKEAFIAV